MAETGTLCDPTESCMSSPNIPSKQAMVHLYLSRMKGLIGQINQVNRRPLMATAPRRARVAKPGTQRQGHDSRSLLASGIGLTLLASLGTYNPQHQLIKLSSISTRLSEVAGAKSFRTGCGSSLGRMPASNYSLEI